MKCVNKILKVCHNFKKVAVIYSKEGGKIFLNNQLLTIEKRIGVYALRANGKYFYIGESTYIPKRIAEHLGTMTRASKDYFGILGI